MGQKPYTQYLYTQMVAKLHTRSRSTARRRTAHRIAHTNACQIEIVHTLHLFCV